MENKTCGNCVWGSFQNGDEYFWHGVCSCPAPAWAERAEPTISRIGDRYDYAQTCHFYDTQYGQKQKGGEE
jgi:hypothetical protein